ncbi:DUF5392 family protein [Amphibacillus cookii]|uniref:DUF5392 family protein n=1 Tax=Amphibacillus cookii TaxID=767787 RepID=UPI00195CB58E|nr:DUF5392 family protein [Amphibacillus cookii]MBM7540373.1 hypothetical protein [Amphibacillus cookii]
MNPAQFEQLPPFIKQEMDVISAKIRPLMKKVSAYYMFGFPLMLIGLLSMGMYLFDNSLNVETMMIPSVYALIAAAGVALFKESRFLKKQIHQVGKNYMVERIDKSEIIEEEEKNHYIKTVKKQVKMDLQPFFKFLTEENKRKHIDYFR